MSAHLFDDGVMRVFAIVGEVRDGVRVESLKSVCEAWYGDIGVGFKEWNERDANARKPEGRVRTWQDRRIKTGHLLVFLDGRQCLAGRVYHGSMGGYSRDIGANAGLPITDITLETCVKQYQIP